MGRKRSGKRQYFYFCAVGLISIVLAACAPIRTLMGQESCAHLQRGQDLIRQGDFEGALRENQKVLSLSPESPPGDAALFNMGLIQVHYANPKKDYKKALAYFTRVENKFPRSPLAEEARVWIGVLETPEKTEGQDSRLHLQRMQKLIRRGNFEGALQENQKVLTLSPKSPPGDAALFSMGLIYIHYANPIKDYGKALGFFRQLQSDFPESPLTEEAKVWVGVLEAMEKAMQVDIEIEEKKKELTR